MRLKGIKRWIALDTDPFLTVSLYLNVDGRLYPSREYEIALKELVRQAQRDLEGIPEDIQNVARRDLERVETYVREEFVRGDARLLVIFSCEPADLFEVITFGVPLKSQLYLHPKGPYTAPLLMALAGYADALAIMVSRERARGFFYQVGRLEELGQVREEVPAQVRYGGFKGYEQKRISRHVEEHVHWFLKHVASVAREWFELHDPDLVILMGSNEITTTLTHWLPYEITQRLGATIDYFVDIGGLNEIRSRIEQAVTDYERQRMRQWVERLHQQIPHRAVVGVAATLQALDTWRCAALLFDPNETVPGMRCSSCGYLALLETTCPHCGIPLERVQNLIVEAVELAVQQGADLYPILYDSTLVQSVQTMSALLRF